MLVKYSKPSTDYSDLYSNYRQIENGEWFKLAAFPVPLKARPGNPLIGNGPPGSGSQWSFSIAEDREGKTYSITLGQAADRNYSVAIGDGSWNSYCFEQEPGSSLLIQPLTEAEVRKVHEAVSETFKTFKHSEVVYHV